MTTSTRVALALVSVALISGLAGCSVEPETKLIASKQQTFTIVALRPPKHFYADLQDEKGQVFKHVYVSKHCNSWRQIKLGSTITLAVNQYERNNETWGSIAAGPVCPTH